MSIHFPKEFKTYLADPTIKGAFFSMPETKGHHPRDCKNCGGIGVMYLFLAFGGPFRDPPQGKDIIAHWADNKWWAGKNEGGICPDCKGTGVDPKYVEKPAVHNPISTAKIFKPIPQVEVAEDYTDI